MHVEAEPVAGAVHVERLVGFALDEAVDAQGFLHFIYGGAPDVARDGHGGTDGGDEDDYVTMSNADFLELVKSRGFKNAVWETRAVVHCRYLNSERHNKVKDFIDEDSILAVYLAPTSLRELEGYLMKFQMGIGDPNKNQVKFTVTEVKAKGFNFMKLTFSTAKDSELEFDDK